MADWVAWHEKYDLPDSSPARRWPKSWRWISAGLVMPLAIIASVYLASFWPGHPAAYRRWRARQPEHYRYEIFWQDARSIPYHWQVEVQAGQMVQVLDLASGQALPAQAIRYAEEFVLIDNLFQRIDERIQPQADIGPNVGRAYPGLVQFLRIKGAPIPSAWVCVTPLPWVHYQRDWGYPSQVIYETNPCIATLAWSTRVEVTISNFQPLP